MSPPPVTARARTRKASPTKASITKSNILILAQREDAHAERLCTEIERLGSTPVRIDAEDVKDLRVTFASGHLSIAPTGSLASIRSAFVRRRPNSRDFGISDHMAVAEVDEYVLLQREMLLQDAIFSLELTAKFYNPFGATVQFLGKLTQHLIAQRVGLDVADTLAGGSNGDVKDFVSEIRNSGARVCTKPLAQKYLMQAGERHIRYTELLPDAVDLDTEDFETCPILFQAYIEKSYELRVTVVDNKVMAVRIDSQEAPEQTKIDWRKYNIPRTPHSIYDLPDEVADKCLKFHQLSGLRYSAFDFVRAIDGRYVFLETNPSGQWLWLENLTGLPITREIASSLCS